MLNQKWNALTTYWLHQQLPAPEIQRWHFIIEQRENWMNEWIHAVLLISWNHRSLVRTFSLSQCIALPVKDVKSDRPPVATSWGRIYWIRTNIFHPFWNSLGCRSPNSSQAFFSLWHHQPMCSAFPLDSLQMLVPYMSSPDAQGLCT